MDTKDEFEQEFEKIAAAGSASNDAPVDPAPAPEPIAAEPAPAPAAAQAGEPAAPAAPPTVEELQRQLEEANARARDYESRERGSAARASHVAKVNNLLEQTVAELRRKLEEPAAKPAASPAPVAEKDVLTEAPDLDAAVRKRIDAAVADRDQKIADLTKRLNDLGVTTETVRKHVDPLVEQNKQQVYENTYAELDKRFSPQWREDRKSQEFEDWIEKQPQQIQHLFSNAVAASDCAKVLSLFYSETGKVRGPAPAPAPTASAPAPAGAAPSPEQRLRLASGIPSRGTSTRRAPDPNDFDSAFAEAAQKLKQA